MSTYESTAVPTNADFTAALERIDWRAPWLDAYVERGMRWQGGARHAPGSFVHMLADEARAAGHVTGEGRPLSFIEQDDLPAGTAYEAHIARTGCVPTRRNLHDFFNALVWLTYPRTKAVLNERQARAIERDGVKGARGSERDFLTLFDENAVLFVCSDPALSAALTAFDWHRLFLDKRADWGKRCEVRVFGHALLEKLVAPYKACTGHAWIVPAPPEYFEWAHDRQNGWIDEAVAETLAHSALETRHYAPLPLLGVPGFWTANSDPAFYDDAVVFRPGRRVRSTSARI